MRTGWMLALATSWAVAQDAKPADKIGTSKAPAVSTKMLAEAQKRKSAAVALTSQVGAQAQGASTYEGILRKDFAAVKGTLEIYARGPLYLVNTGGRFDPPDKLEGEPALQAMGFRNPSLYLSELGRLSASASFGGDEAVDGKECRVVDYVADGPLIKQHLKELGERLDKAMSGAGGAFGVGDLIKFANVLDEKTTVATYRVCVGREDLLPARLEFVMRPKVKPGSLPPQIRLPDLDQKVDIRFSKWDEEVPFEIAGFIKSKWGVK